MACDTSAHLECERPRPRNRGVWRPCLSPRHVRHDVLDTGRTGPDRRAGQVSADLSQAKRQFVEDDTGNLQLGPSTATASACATAKIVAISKWEPKLVPPKDRLKAKLPTRGGRDMDSMLHYLSVHPHEKDRVRSGCAACRVMRFGGRGTL